MTRLDLIAPSEAPHPSPRALRNAGQSVQALGSSTTRSCRPRIWPIITLGASIHECAPPSQPSAGIVPLLAVAASATGRAAQSRQTPADQVRPGEQVQLSGVEQWRLVAGLFQESDPRPSSSMSRQTASREVDQGQAPGAIPVESFTADSNSTAPPRRVGHPECAGSVNDATSTNRRC